MNWHDEARRLRANGAKVRDIPGLLRINVTFQRVQQVCRGVECPINHMREARKRNIWKAIAAPKPPNKTCWTNGQDQFLREHYRVDKSAAQIGCALGHSKNAVIGRARRLGLSEARA